MWRNSSQIIHVSDIGLIASHPRHALRLCGTAIFLGLRESRGLNRCPNRKSGALGLAGAGCKAKPPKREDTHYALVERLLPSDSLSAFVDRRTSKGESIRYWSVLDLNSFFW
jgi:hypothetical protein